MRISLTQAWDFFSLSAILLAVCTRAWGIHALGWGTTMSLIDRDTQSQATRIRVSNSSCLCLCLYACGRVRICENVGIYVCMHVWIFPFFLSVHLIVLYHSSSWIPPTKPVLSLAFSPSLCAVLFFSLFRFLSFSPPPSLRFYLSITSLFLLFFLSLLLSLSLYLSLRVSLSLSHVFNQRVIHTHQQLITRHYTILLLSGTCARAHRGLPT